MLAEQLGRGAAALRAEGGPDAEAVHDVRKQLKKSRSVLRLARADLGPAVALHANGELRRVGADLALQRDADSLVEAVERLLSPASDPDGDHSAPVTTDPATRQALSVVHEMLVARAERVRSHGALDRSTVIGAARTLEQTLAWLQLVPAQVTGWDALAPGFTRQYRRGRTALRSLPDQPTVDELHEWRKRVKDMWYHQRLLRRLWTDAQRPVVAAADEVASALGDDHDLGLLLAHLMPDAGHRTALGAADDGFEALPVTPDVRSLVTVAIAASRTELQSHARRLGARLFADDPRAWRDRHGSWWAAVARDPVPVTDAADATGATVATGAIAATDVNPAGGSQPVDLVL